MVYRNIKFDPKYVARYTGRSPSVARALTEYMLLENMIEESLVSINGLATLFEREGTVAWDKTRDHLRGMVRDVKGACLEHKTLKHYQTEEIRKHLKTRVYGKGAGLVRLCQILHQRWAGQHAGLPNTALAGVIYGQLEDARVEDIWRVVSDLTGEDLAPRTDRAVAICQNLERLRGPDAAHLVASMRPMKTHFGLDFDKMPMDPEQKLGDEAGSESKQNQKRPRMPRWCGLTLGVLGLTSIVLASMVFQNAREFHEASQEFGPAYAAEIEAADNVDAKIGKAFTLYENGQYEEAIILLDSIPWADIPYGKRRTVMFYRGRAAAGLGRLYEARGNLLYAFNLYSEDNSWANMSGTLSEVAKTYLFEDINQTNQLLDRSWIILAKSNSKTKYREILYWHAIKFDAELYQGHIASALEVAEKRTRLASERDALAFALSDLFLSHTLSGNIELAEILQEEIDMLGFSSEYFDAYHLVHRIVYLSTIGRPYGQELQEIGSLANEMLSNRLSKVSQRYSLNIEY